jgi:CheY-like chemotaxis protein
MLAGMNSLRSAPLLLLVEDDVDAVELFHHLFLKICPEWQFVRVSNGLEALEFMMHQRLPDVLVTDLKMPHMTGQELIRWLRLNPAFPRIPILVLSGNSDSSLAQELQDMGADEYICKDSSLDELKSALGRFTRIPSDKQHPFHVASST